MKTRLYVGLDVHKETITIAAAEAGGSSGARLVCTTTNDLQVLERHLRRIAAAAGTEPGGLSVAYEASPPPPRVPPSAPPVPSCTHRLYLIKPYV